MIAVLIHMRDQLRFSRIAHTVLILLVTERYNRHTVLLLTVLLVHDLRQLFLCQELLHLALAACDLPDILHLTADRLHGVKVEIYPRHTQLVRQRQHRLKRVQCIFLL